MKIQRTESAQQWIELFPEINIPETAQQCFNGLRSIEGTNAPNINNGINKIVGILNDAKIKVVPTLKNFMSGIAGIDYLCAKNFDISFDNLLKETEIWYVTTDDDNTTKNVLNQFIGDGTHTAVSILEDSDNLLGAYSSSTGAVFIWIDKISLLPNPEITLQAILLHELIHAMLDINPHGFNLSTQQWERLGYGFDADEENKIADALVYIAVKDCGNEDAIDAVTKLFRKHPRQFSQISGIANLNQQVLVDNIANALKPRFILMPRLETLNKFYFYTLDDGSEPTPVKKNFAITAIENKLDEFENPDKNNDGLFREELDWNTIVSLESPFHSNYNSDFVTIKYSKYDVDNYPFAYKRIVINKASELSCELKEYLIFPGNVLYRCITSLNFTKMSEGIDEYKITEDIVDSMFSITKFEKVDIPNLAEYYKHLISLINNKSEYQY